MNGQRQQSPIGDELTNILLIGIGGALGFALILRAAGSVAAFLSGLPQPTVGLTGGVAVFFYLANPGAELGVSGLNPVVFWIVAALLIGIVLTAVLRVWSLVRRHTRRVKVDPHRQEGTATAAEVAQVASTRELMRRAGILRPSLDKPEPADVGLRLGTAHRRPVWASIEDSILLIGPPDPVKACIS